MAQLGSAVPRTPRTLPEERFVSLLVSIYCSQEQLAEEEGGHFEGALGTSSREAADPTGETKTL